MPEEQLEQEAEQVALREAPSLRRHSGATVPLDADFFVEPPPEIGPLLTADSTLRQDKTALSANARLAVATVVALAIYIAGRYGVGLFLGDGFTALLSVVSAAVALLIGAAVWFALRFRHRCTYVGTDGVARFTLRGSRGGKLERDLLVFENAESLHTAETRQYVNGVYAGTSYRFSWSDANGQTLLKLSGTHQGNKSLPKDKDPYHFARSAEAAWSNHMLARLQTEMDAKGFVEFPVGTRRAVRVGPGFLEFDWDGTAARCEAEEIESIGIREGVFQIRHRDATWFGRRGKFKFKYASMANARLFLLALERCLGYRFD